MKTFPISFKKTSALTLVFLGLTLSSCSPSWLADPLTRYLEKTTGLTIRIQETDWTLRPLSLTWRKIEIECREPDFRVGMSMDRLALQLGWEFSDRFPFLPRFQVDRLEADRPRGIIRVTGRKTQTDWRARFKRIPPVRALAIRGFSGEMGDAQWVFCFSSGVDLSGSFSPETGVRLKVQSGPVRGIPARGFTLAAAGVRGDLELNAAVEPVTWKGQVDFSRMEIETPRIRLAGITGGCTLRGRGKNLEIRDLEGRLSGLQGIFQGFRVEGQGDLVVRGAVRLEPEGQKEAIIPSLILNLEESRVSLKKGDHRWIGRVSGELELGGSVTRPRLQGQVRLAEVRGELADLRLGGLRGLIPIKGTYPDLSLAGVKVRADEVVWRSPAFPWRLTHPAADFSAAILKSGRHLSLQDIRLGAQEWGVLTGTLEFDRRTGAVPNGSAVLTGFPLERLLGLLSVGGRPSDAQKAPLQGRVSWQRETVGAPWEFRVDLETTGLTRPWKVSPWGLEDLGGRLRARVTRDPVREEWSGEGQLGLNRGQVFGKLWTIRLEDYPLELDWSGKLRVNGKGRFLGGQARGTFLPLGPWEVSGRLDWEGGDWNYEARLTAEQVALNGLYRFWRDQADKETRAGLAEADLLGTVATNFTLAGNKEGGRILGRLRGADLQAAEGDSAWRLKVKNLELPLRQAFGNWADPGSEAPVDGGLAVEEFHSSWIQVRDLEIPVRVRINHLEIPGILTLPLAGGELILDTPVLSWPERQPILEVGLRLKGVDLNALFPAYSFQGSLQGDLGRVRFDAGQVKGPGSLKAYVFDGWVEARDWGVVDPFGPDRRLQAALVFDYINLEKVTSLFSFGHISGYIQGRVDDLVIKGNLPERFHLTLKTREVEGAAQRINMKAVENVSLLGTGFGEPGELEKGINRWFQDYAYEEIGLSCRLYDDTFTLRGTIFAGDTEYLVKSPGWYGIDVINRNPENEISFSDMLERLRRIRSKRDPGGNPNGQ
jgi:hypothetical protein